MIVSLLLFILDRKFDNRIERNSNTNNTFTSITNNSTHANQIPSSNVTNSVTHSVISVNKNSSGGDIQNEITKIKSVTTNTNITNNKSVNFSNNMTVLNTLSQNRVSNDNISTTSFKQDLMSKSVNFNLQEEENMMKAELKVKENELISLTKAYKELKQKYNTKKKALQDKKILYSQLSSTNQMSLDLICEKMSSLGKKI